MATRLPGGLWYEPADLGVNAVVIAPTLNVVGNIVPWCAACKFSRVGMFLEFNAGTGTPLDVRLRAFDIDGQLAISFSDGMIWNNIPNNPDAVLWIGDNTPRARVGTIATTSTAVPLVSPFAQFQVVNQDAANAVTVSLRVLLGY